MNFTTPFGGLSRLKPNWKDFRFESPATIAGRKIFEKTASASRVVQGFIENQNWANLRWSGSLNPVQTYDPPALPDTRDPPSEIYGEAHRLVRPDLAHPTRVLTPATGHRLITSSTTIFSPVRGAFGKFNHTKNEPKSVGSRRRANQLVVSPVPIRCWFSRAS